MQHLKALKTLPKSTEHKPAKPLAVPLSPLQELNVAVNGILQSSFFPTERSRLLALSWRPTVSIIVPEASKASLTGIEATITNVLLHPEFASPTVLRADVIEDSDNDPGLLDMSAEQDESKPGHVGGFSGFSLRRRILLKSVARNPRRDSRLEQTVWVFLDESQDDGRLLVVSVPHVVDLTAIPFFFPTVHALAFVVEDEKLSVHYLLPQTTADNDLPGMASDSPSTKRNHRMARQLLILLSKHLSQPNYSKRVNHDIIVPREKYQTIFLRLKEKYGPRLCKLFAIEGTGKGERETEKVFEEVGIASWLIGIWEDMYQKPTTEVEKLQNLSISQPNLMPQRNDLLKWSGFVDLGCGNGVLVDILNNEGWPGWGFDARKRNSWTQFDSSVQQRLVEMVLIPYMLVRPQEYREITIPSNHISCMPQPITKTHLGLDEVDFLKSTDSSTKNKTEGQEALKAIHHGIFPAGTFLISNHGDELTAWTPLLASLTQCPFLIIPCCSHNLSGQRFRATPRLTIGDRKNGKESAYQSLIGYVEAMCEEVQVPVEKEWLRIPSTRNVALLGRKYVQNKNEGANEKEQLDERERVVKSVLDKEGGAVGWVETAIGLRERQLRGGRH